MQFMHGFCSVHESVCGLRSVLSGEGVRGRSKSMLVLCVREYACWCVRGSFLSEHFWKY